MTKIIIKHAIVTTLCFVLFFCLSLLWANSVMYYDLIFTTCLTIPIILIIRFLDDYIRDVIIILNDNKTTLATFLSGIVIFGAFMAAVLIYIYVFHKTDIFVNILDHLKFLPLDGLRNKFNIY